MNDEKIIQNRDKDNWYTTSADTFPYGLFLYYLSEGLYDKEGQESYVNTIPITHSGCIVSVQVSPFLDKDDFLLNKIPYDTERFTYKEDGSQFDLSGKEPDVYRIVQLTNNSIDRPAMKTKELGTFKCYSPTKSIGGGRDWRNESKLYDYPYSFAYLTDGMNSPYEIKYHLCKDNDNKVKVKCSLSSSMDFSYIIENYKNDFDGFLEGYTSTANLELPTTSNQYAQYIALNKNQMKANKIDSLLSSTLMGVGAGSTLGSVVPGVGNVVGGMMGGVMGALKGMNSANSQEKDLRNTPNSLNTQGSDFIHGYNNSGKSLKIVRYKQRTEYMRKIGDYFAMYGYKQNKILNLGEQLRSRHYYNFIKTSGANITGEGVPKNHINTIKQIFDKGVTIWHINREGVNPLDYSKDNKEI
ncbi:MAG: hypothetical protein ACRDB9_09000 [Cetobacterium sp.]